MRQLGERDPSAVLTVRQIDETGQEDAASESDRIMVHLARQVVVIGAETQGGQ